MGFFILELSSVWQSTWLISSLSWVQILQFQLLSYSIVGNKLKDVKIIKLISKKDLDGLISSGIIGICHQTGNRSEQGIHSCGYYDVKKYNYGKHNNLGDNNYLKTNYAHIGVSITAHKIYIEDKYVK